MNSIKERTLNFYLWEQQGRGWQRFVDPIQLEPVFEPFYIHTLKRNADHTNEYIDDGKVNLFSGLINLFTKKKGLTLPSEKEPLAYVSKSLYVPLYCFSVSLPKGYTVKPEMVEQLLLMFSYSAYSLSFEIVANRSGIRLQFVARQTDAQMVRSQLKAYFPEVAVQEYPEGLTNIIDESLHTWWYEFGLKEEFMRPLKMAAKFDPDPYISLFAMLDNLKHGEQATVQVLFQSTVNSWAESILQSVSDSKGQSFFIDAPEMLPLAKEKVSAPLFAVVVRVIAQADTKDGSATLRKHLANGLTQLSNSGVNSLMPLVTRDYTENDIEDIYDRESRRLGMLLNSKELATLVHLPSASVVSNKLVRDASKTKMLPEIAIGHKLVVGMNYHQGIERTATISSNQRLKHTHIIGATGTGKSTLLLNLITQDIANGNGIAVLDPHGDLIESIISHIPEHRHRDVILIDPSDSEYPVGFNILYAHTEVEKELLSSDLVTAFKRLSTSWGDQINSILANAILAFLESNVGGTLLDLRRFLVEKSFRDSFLKTVNDPSILYYWQKEYPLLKSNSIGPILTRLDSFLRPKLIRNMVAQRKGLDFENFMDSQKIVLVKLSQGLIGTENSYLLGTFIVSKINQAALARQAKFKDDRKDFYLYIDEFQNFTTASMSSILSGARKYHLALVLAHQDMQQVLKQDAELASSVLSNAGTRICFRVGDTDAKRFEDGFSSFTSQDLQNLRTGEAVVRIDRPENDFNIKTAPLPAIEGSNAQEARNALINLSRSTYGTPKEEVDRIIRELVQDYTVPEISEKRPLTTEEPQEIEQPEVIIQPSEEAKPYTPLSPIERKAESQHRYLQALIKKMAEARSYKAIIEELTPDGKGRVDVSLERNKQRIACEVCITTPREWELQNIQKCLAAGYDLVVSISPDKKVLQNIKRQVETTVSPEQQAKVLYFEPEVFFLYLDTAIASAPTTETKYKGYRVKVDYDTVSETEAKSKQENILKAILKSRIRK